VYIIIGQGIAGATAAVELRKQDRQTPVTVITNEHEYLYSRIDLPDIIAGKYTPSEATLKRAEDFDCLGITCVMGEKVTAVLPRQKTVEVLSGKKLQYHKLLLATGSLPVLPSIFDSTQAGVYSLWTMLQAEKIIESASRASKVVVVGAGLIGLKTALALRKRGLEVTVVEKLQRVLPRQLDDAASEMLIDRLREMGLEIMVNAGVEGIAAVKGTVSGLHLVNGFLGADMVIVAIGVKPNIELAVSAGIHTERGIIVNEFQQTSIPDIYAAGDVAETFDRLTGDSTVSSTWPVAVEHGRIAACNMAGRKETYDGSCAMNAVEIAGIPMVSIGDIDGRTDDCVLIDRRGDAYRKVVIRDNVVRGALFMGDIRQAGVIGALVSRRVELRTAEKLISPYFSFADLIAL
jgi:nitrite reductase (NADH) large subunit